MIDKVEQSSVLELFGLESEDVESCHYRNVNGSAVIDIVLVPSYEPCPICGSASPKIKDYTTRPIKHSILVDRKCILNYRARRYKCSDCAHTYMETNPFVFGSKSISAATVQCILKDLKNFNETFSSVARRYHISPTSAASIFDAHVSIPRKTLPEVINFDEVYAFKHFSDKYVCVLLDFYASKPIDVLNSRRLDHLLAYFQKIPYEERKAVKACCFDMYDTYRSVMKSCFPNAIGCVDHFHVSQELGRKVERVRIRIMKGYEKDSDEYYLLKKFNWMLYQHRNNNAEDRKPLFDPNQPRKLNRRLQLYLNYFDLRTKLLEIDHQLQEVSDLSEDLRDFYNNATSDNAEVALKDLINQFKKSDIPEMREFSRTLNKWKIEIVNSITVYDYAYKINYKDGSVKIRKVRLTNAIIENRNAIIKCLKKNANGYRNWERFRNRILYVLDKDANYLLNPIIKKK